MINWQEKTDPEINNAVKLVLISKHEKESDFDKFFLKLLKCSDLDYCNNPAFSWTIIQRARISLEFHGRDCTASARVAKGLFIDEVSVFTHKNPLRAAMIVFLMMNEK